MYKIYRRRAALGDHEEGVWSTEGGSKAVLLLLPGTTEPRWYSERSLNPKVGFFAVSLS